MSKLELLKALIGHNEWANNQVLATASKLSERELGADDSVPHGGIVPLLAHSLVAPQRWLFEWEGSATFDIEEIRALKTLDETRVVYEHTHAELRRFFDGMNEGDTVRTFELSERWLNHAGKGVPLWQPAMQVILHSMQHRAELAEALTKRGASPGELDFIGWAVEEAYGPIEE